MRICAWCFCHSYTMYTAYILRDVAVKSWVQYAWFWRKTAPEEREWVIHMKKILYKKLLTQKQPQFAICRRTFHKWKQTNIITDNILVCWPVILHSYLNEVNKLNTRQPKKQYSKNWPTPFPGRMSYKATKPDLALSVVYLSMFYCIVDY